MQPLKDRQRLGAPLGQCQIGSDTLQHGQVIGIGRSQQLAAEPD
jgi:hypothetical protein